jgi:hypothetical protein
MAAVAAACCCCTSALGALLYRRQQQSLAQRQRYEALAQAEEEDDGDEDERYEDEDEEFEDVAPAAASRATALPDGSDGYSTPVAGRAQPLSASTISWKDEMDDELRQFDEMTSVRLSFLPTHARPCARRASISVRDLTAEGGVF